MIVVEDRLRDLFNLIPDIQVNASTTKKLSFSFGRDDAINKYIELSNSTCYPLVWMLPSKDEYDRSTGKTTKNLSLIVAHLETRDDLLNEHRYESSFKYVLNPLVNYIVQALENSSITNVISDEITTYKDPNFTDKAENFSIDKWDVIRLDCKIEINNHCLKTIKWLN